MYFLISFDSIFSIAYLEYTRLRGGVCIRPLIELQIDSLENGYIEIFAVFICNQQYKQKFMIVNGTVRLANNNVGEWIYDCHKYKI